MCFQAFDIEMQLGKVLSKFLSKYFKIFQSYLRFEYLYKEIKL